MRRWHPDVLTQRGWKQGAHRALDDIRESVSELQLYRTLVFCEPDEVARRLADMQAAESAQGEQPAQGEQSAEAVDAVAEADAE